MSCGDRGLGLQGPGALATRGREYSPDMYSGGPDMWMNLERNGLVRSSETSEEPSDLVPRIAS